MRTAPTGNLALIRVLAAIAAAIASYMLVTALQGGIWPAAVRPAAARACSPAAGRTGWAYRSARRPCCSMCRCSRRRSGRRRASGRPAGKALAFLLWAACPILAGAVWFLSLQLLTVRQLCPYCLAAHLAGAVAASDCRATAIRSGTVTSATPRCSRDAFLIAGPGSTAPPATRSNRFACGAAPGRHLEIFNGLFRINVDEVP